MQAVQVGPFKLDTAKVAEARARFESNAPYRCKDMTTFDEYLELFALDCTSFVSIGENRPEQRRLTREMVRQIYERYFADLFPCRPGGHARRKLCTLKTIEIESRELPTDGVIKEVAEVAVRNGLTFEKEQRRGGWELSRFKKQVLWLNRKRCLVKWTTRRWQASLSHKKFYARFQLRSKNFLESVDFAVFVQKIPGFPERFFIIPTADLLKTWGDEKTIRSFYIPLERLSAYQTQVDWWQYENAWHLLKNKRPAS